ncbi:MAG: YggS family pyridoxal phosphate-dependent enzyme [Candidatus Margulisbacteria bacterium]|nr:YggS family pyridoxal phosphate-dependent enzyme [Candidatus Margulisiibacteriota bacterium]
MSIKENIAAVRARLRPGVKLVAVIKNVPLDDIYRALDAGLTDVAENRVQEAAERAGLIRAKFPGTTIHFIGHLQTNKVGQAVNLFDIIQSLDSERLARELDKKAGAAEKIMPVLIEVNVSGEASKQGVPVSAAAGLIRSVAALKNLKIGGLMTMAEVGNAEPSFKGLRTFRDSLNMPGVDLSCLSMGMSDDFEAAVAAGSTLVRIGRAIFSGG